MRTTIYATITDPRAAYDYLDWEVRGTLSGRLPEVGPSYSHGGLPADGPYVEDLEYEYEPGKWTDIPEEWDEDNVIEALLDQAGL